MTAIDYAALVERLKRLAGNDPLFATKAVDRSVLIEAADAVERLTRPGGEVEPVARYLGRESEYGYFCIDLHDDLEERADLYSAETVARLIAERDDASNAALDARFKLLNSDLDCTTLQEQMKTLRELVRNSTEYRLGVPAYELAATEPKKGEKK